MGVRSDRREEDIARRRRLQRRALARFRLREDAGLAARVHERRQQPRADGLALDRGADLHAVERTRLADGALLTMPFDETLDKNLSPPARRHLDPPRQFLEVSVAPVLRRVEERRVDAQEGGHLGDPASGRAQACGSGQTIGRRGGGGALRRRVSLALRGHDPSKRNRRSRRRDQNRSAPSPKARQ